MELQMSAELYGMILIILFLVSFATWNVIRAIYELHESQRKSAKEDFDKFLEKSREDFKKFTEKSRVEFNNFTEKSREDFEKFTKKVDNKLEKMTETIEANRVEHKEGQEKIENMIEMNEEKNQAEHSELKH